MDILSIFSKKKYTAALVGLGRIGFSLGLDEKREQPASHTMSFLDNKRIELSFGIDTDVQKADEWKKFMCAHKQEPSVFYSSKEFYESGAQPDIITVAVNEKSHLEECLLAIKAKPKLVILEKPVALNTIEAEKIRAAAEENGVPVMVNHERRFAADYQAAKSFIKNIGEIQSVRAEFCSGLRVYAKQFEEDGSYSLIHDGTHLVDIVSFLLDEELSSPVVTGVFRDADGIVRNLSAHFSTAKVSEISVNISGRSKFFAFGVDILGTEGRIVIGNGYAKFYETADSTLYTGFSSLSSKKVRFPKKTGYFSNMIQNAVDFLDGKAVLYSPLDSAISDLRTLEEIKEKL
ncbi:MAG: Gfo/Idh/MocA family oxidoreductase [Treponema sp.]|nr:Gfo/Idh/MocA family oxidoreductase [Treponema sp.]